MTTGPKVIRWQANPERRAALKPIDSLASYIDRAMATIAPRTGAAAIPATCSPS